MLRMIESTKRANDGFLSSRLLQRIHISDTLIPIQRRNINYGFIGVVHYLVQ